MKRKILFVDEDQNVLDGFRAMLHMKRREWKCSFALNAKKGLEALSEEQFDVIIADMCLPDMDGASFFKKIEKIQPASIRIVLSGYSEMQNLLKSSQYAHQFLSKPCNTETLISTIQRVIDLDDILTHKSLRKIVAQINSLPAIQDLYIKIAKELEQKEPDLAQVAKLVESDIGISATLLKVVNSPFFGFYERIFSPTRAVVLLGVDALKGLILGVQLLDKIDLSHAPGYSFNKLWEHCLQTGYFAKIIATAINNDKEFIESCFVGGMLHDVGKLVLVTQMGDLYQPLLKRARNEGGPILDYELSEMEISHAEIGAYLLGVWGFKESIVRGVYGHHKPSLCGQEASPALIIHIANALQHELTTWNPEYIFSELDMEYIESLDLTNKLDDWRTACRLHLE